MVNVVEPQRRARSGPTWQGEFFLGADGERPGQHGAAALRRAQLAHDRLLRRARHHPASASSRDSSSGYFRGWTDGVISRVLDIIWAFPVILLGIALGTALALGGLKIGPITVAGNSLAIPILVIAVVYVPYIARPTARAGARHCARRSSSRQRARRDIGDLPHRVLGDPAQRRSRRIIVFFPLLVANAILLEAALSFLGAGVQPPEPSWGTMIDEGVGAHLERSVSGDRPGRDAGRSRCSP